MARTLKAGRPADDVKIFPGQEFILAPTAKEAEEKHRWVREQQVGPQTAIAYLEQFWGRTLTEYDPDGPLPDIDPVVEVTDATRGNAFHGKSARELAAEWRAEATEKGLSIRQFVSKRSQLNGRGLVGSYDDVADLLAEYAHSGAVDGFNITPWIVPTGPGRHREPPCPQAAGPRRLPHRVRRRHPSGKPGAAGPVDTPQRFAGIGEREQERGSRMNATTHVSAASRFRRTAVTSALLGTVALLVASCGGAADAGSRQSADAAPVSGGNLGFAVSVDRGCIDPQQVGNNDAIAIARQTVASLTAQDPKTGEIVPWLAEKFEANTDRHQLHLYPEERCHVCRRDGH